VYASDTFVNVSDVIGFQGFTVTTVLVIEPVFAYIVYVVVDKGVNPLSV
jgi:hypothetical protein